MRFIGQGIAFAALCGSAAWLEVAGKDAFGLWCLVGIWVICGDWK